MITELKPYHDDKELIRMLTDPVKKTEYPIKHKFDAEIVYQLSLKSAESYLLLLWKMLHGLPSDIAGDRNDLEMMQYFYQTSKLWFRKDSAPVDSDLFIGRFLSSVALHIADKLDKIVVDYVIHTTKAIKVKSKVEMLDQIVSCFSQLAKNMICNKPYAEESDKLFEMATICADGGIHRRTRLIRVYNEQMTILRDTTKNGILGSDFMIEDSILINNVILLAYMMVTESKPDEMFSIDPDIKFSDEMAVKRVVTKLGKRILYYKDLIIEGEKMSQTDKGIVSRLYEIFVDCKPQFKYRYMDLARDDYLREGCRALSYLGFLSQSKVVRSILQKMIY